MIKKGVSFGWFRKQENYHQANEKNAGCQQLSIKHSTVKLAEL